MSVLPPSIGKSAQAVCREVKAALKVNHKLSVMHVRILAVEAKIKA